jgi:hypothetical protein
MWPGNSDAHRVEVRTVPLRSLPHINSVQSNHSPSNGSMD